MTNDQMRWICGKCGEPIEDGQGGIDLYNLKRTLGPIGAYPRESSPTEPLGMKPVKPGLLPIYSEVELNDLDWETNKTVGIRVVHKRCDQTGRCGYWIEVERASTADEWINWLAHLSEKDWCGELEFMALSRMWQSMRRAVAEVAS